MEKSRVLVLDIETAPMTAYIWGLKDQNISLNQIIQDWSVLAWAAKWLDNDYVWYADVNGQRDLHSDRSILGKLWSLLDEADIVITQYGSGFDCPRLNARFIMHGMKPPSPYKHLDTYRIAKKVADFTSNKLEYLTEKLCTKYKKLSHGRFPGMSLWTECLKRNPKAWAEMKKYNIHDVLSTEELYMKLRAWAPANAPAVYNDNGVCKTCGKAQLQKRGIDRTKTFKWQRLKCNGCGTWQRGDKLK
jgi:hypothetical protein